MKLRTILRWAEKNKDIKRIIDFYEDRFLGEVLFIEDIIDKDEDIEIAKDGRGFYKFFKMEMYKRGTNEFLEDKDYPKPNYAGFPYFF
jgi:hypothetical protein